MASPACREGGDRRLQYQGWLGVGRPLKGGDLRVTASGGGFMRVVKLIRAVRGRFRSYGGRSTTMSPRALSKGPEDPPVPPGWQDVRDRIEKLEQDPRRRPLLVNARKRLAPVLAAQGSLTFLRLEKGLSRRALAALCSIDVSQLSRIEAGSEDPRLSVCRRLAQALDESLNVIATAIAASGQKEPKRAPGPT